MKTSLETTTLVGYVSKQMAGFFPDGNIPPAVLLPLVETALARLEACLSGVKWPGYEVDGRYFFNHRHSDQYATFLYFLANSAKDRAPDVAEKAYLLNKALHGLEAYYEIQLPEQFLLVHPVGTILGRATYNNGFTVYQNCSVGSNLTGEYPVIEENVALFSGSRVIGDCRIGANTMIATGTTVLNTDVPATSIAVMDAGQLTFKKSRRNVKNFAFFGIE